MLAASATKVAFVGMARTWALELWTSASPQMPRPDRRHRMLYAVLPKVNSREETPANGIAVKRLGRVSDVTRAARL
jgi:amino acid transporter